MFTFAFTFMFMIMIMIVSTGKKLALARRFVARKTIELLSNKVDTQWLYLCLET